MPKKKTRRRKAKKTKLSLAERKQRRIERQFKVQINTIFKNSGFDQIATRNKGFEFRGRRGEIDNIFLYENILVISEDTCSSTKIKEHINNKAVFFKHLANHEVEFVEFLEENFEGFSERRKVEYDPEEYKLIYLHCSLYPVEEKHTSPHGHMTFFNTTTIRYFLALAKVIHKSARFELFKFLGLKPNDIGHNTGTPKHDYSGFVLPETPSGFPKDYKITTFYIDPKTLIELSYVLRKDNWQDTEGLYQRMLIKNKIKSMREYLAKENRVFVNNVIVSLPNQTKLLDSDGNTLSPSKITRRTDVTISLPKTFDSIGLIDGQHRVFSYHEGSDISEDAISKKRIKQQLLVTGIIFPKTIDPTERMVFEAKLFLEINDKQSRAKGDLKQAIQTIVDPYNSIAIAKSVISRLAKDGPLCGLLQDHYFGDGKIKTTSIVSYALKHVVAFNGEAKSSSLFKIWKNSDKRLLVYQPNSEIRESYVRFCANHINSMLSGYKQMISPKGLWTTNIKESRALTITTINGLIFCLRHLLNEGKTGNQEYYYRGFLKLQVDFRPNKFPYTSSHWRDLGSQMYEDCFE